MLEGCLLVLLLLLLLLTAHPRSIRRWHRHARRLRRVHRTRHVRAWGSTRYLLRHSRRLKRCAIRPTQLARAWCLPGSLGEDHRLL